MQVKTSRARHSVWALLAVGGVLLGSAGSALADSGSSDHQSAPSRQLPIVSADPAPGATNVKPTAPITFRIDLRSPGAKRFAKDFAQAEHADHPNQGDRGHDRIGVVVSGPDGTQRVYTPSHGLSYDAATGVMTVRHATVWQRYAPYQVQVLTDAAWRQFVKAHPGGIRHALRRSGRPLLIQGSRRRSLLIQGS